MVDAVISLKQNAWLLKANMDAAEYLVLSRQVRSKGMHYLSPAGWRGLNCGINSLATIASQVPWNYS
jgi:hypothetical protein